MRKKSFANSLGLCLGEDCYRSVEPAIPEHYYALVEDQFEKNSIRAHVFRFPSSANMARYAVSMSQTCHEQSTKTGSKPNEISSTSTPAGSPRRCF